ncbi:MAG TPA: G8 domain-containing protein [Chthoniobacter sp.]|jgi:hypothetical protein
MKLTLSTTKSLLLGALLTLCGGAFSFSLADCASDIAPVYPTAAQYTHHAIASGAWGNVATWDTGTVPGANAIVDIPAGIEVQIGNNFTGRMSKLVINGTLLFTPTGHGGLSVETVLVSPTGLLSMGTDAAPIGAGYSATITIIDPGPINTTTDPNVMSRGVLVEGKLLMEGAPKTPYVTVTADALKGTSVITPGQAPTGWNASDQVVITGTNFNYNPNWFVVNPSTGAVTTENSPLLENDLCTFTGFNANGTINVSPALTYNHQRSTAANSAPFHCANLTRNVVIQSESLTDTTQRGHLLMLNNNNTLKNSEFLRLGRTDKTLYVTDTDIASGVWELSPGQSTQYPQGLALAPSTFNVRGRYAVHFHECGANLTTGPGIVSGCVVQDTPGWGFVNHSSYANFTNNVAFDFGGAGFVTESGDEAGTFNGNLAIGGVGNGEFPETRILFANYERMNRGDHGFTGDGFWFSGPDLTVTNNIAAGCKGAGFSYWCAGKFIVNINTFAGFPMSRVPTGVTPRTWNWSDTTPGNAATATQALIADIPIRQFSGNTAYSCYHGLRMRFVNEESTAVYGEVGTGYAGEIQGIPSTPKNNQNAVRVNEAITNSTFWNCFDGIHDTYVTQTNFSGIQMSYISPNTGGIGITMMNVNSLCSYTNVGITNYETGVWQGATTQISGTPTITISGDYETFYLGTGNPYGYSHPYVQIYGSAR